MFLCSECNRPARVLYARYFADRIWFFTCRKCAGITYQATMGHRWDRSARRVEKLRARLEWQANKPKHPVGPPMTLGNVRELGVQRLIASCFNDACRHVVLIDVSGYPADTEVPSFCSRVVCAKCGQPRKQDRRAPELERAAAAREPDRQGVAMSRAILFDAIFAIVFATMMVTIARFLWALI